MLNRIRTIMTNARTLKKDRKGLVALEYGLMAGVAAVVIIVGFNVLGSDISAKMVAIGNVVTTASTAGSATASP